METEERITNKRRKSCSPSDPQSVVDLPDTLLEAVAAYLPTISRGLFAVAVTGPSASWHRWNGKQQRPPLSSASKIILSSQNMYHGHINFETIEKSLSAALSDDDCCAFLLCIDAKNVLKRLYLAGCVNITGHGLGPLYGSVVLEQIDLSLVAQDENPSKARIAMIDEDAIVPILSSIVNQHEPNPSLKQIIFPYKWGDGFIRPEMSAFLREFSLLLESRPFDCSGCTANQEDCLRTNGNEWIDGWKMQRFTCYMCLRNCCEDASENDVSFCWLCYKTYCRECVPRMAKCTNCGEMCCSGCNEGNSPC